MSLEDDFNDDEEYLPKKEIIQVPIIDIERDWRNRAMYFKKEYELASLQYNKLGQDILNPNYDLRGWFDPNDKVYFYEKSILEEQTPTEFQKGIERLLGMKDDD